MQTEINSGRVEVKDRNERIFKKNYKKKNGPINVKNQGETIVAYMLVGFIS